MQRRLSARSRHSLQPGDFVLLLIGNDWPTKGISTILQAMTRMAALPMKLLVVGSDKREP